MNNVKLHYLCVGYNGHNQVYGTNSNFYKSKKNSKLKNEFIIDDKNFLHTKRFFIEYLDYCKINFYVEKQR